MAQISFQSRESRSWFLFLHFQRFESYQLFLKCFFLFYLPLLLYVPSSTETILKNVNHFISLPAPNLLAVPHTLRKACRDPHDLALTHLPFHSTYLSCHAGCLLPALAQNTLLQIFWLFLVMSISSQIFPSWLFNGLPAWPHITLFSFIQKVCHSFFFFFFVCLFFVFWPQESKTSPNRELFCLIHYYIPQVAQKVRNLPVSAGDTGGTGLIPGSGRPPWRRAWQPTPVFLPGESRGQRSLVGYSLWGHKESVTTEHACSSSWICFDRLHNMENYHHNLDIKCFHCPKSFLFFVVIPLPLLSVAVNQWPDCPCL